MGKTLIVLAVLCGLYFLFTPAGTVVAGNLTCDFCGKAINGKHYKYRSHQSKTIVICLTCERKMPHCSACRLPVRANDIVNHKGERLCPTCFSQAKFCSLCTKRIKGKYFQQDNSEDLYCQRCYAMYPRCSVCGTPGTVHRLSDGQTVCPSCLPKLPVCGSCGKPIAGKYFQYSTSEKKYCTHCQKTRPKCYTCSVPLGSTSWKFSDGRRICHTCNKRAVTDVVRIRAIVKETEKLIAKQLGMKVTIPYRLQVKDLNKYSSQQAGKAKNGETNQSPLFGSELGLFRRVNGQADIFILYGLPIEMLYETAAHELAHAWQSEHCPPNQSKLLMEGFAQWVAAQVLKIKGYKDALERLEERSDPIYGGGYRKIKQLNQSLGRQRMFQYVQSKS